MDKVEKTKHWIGESKEAIENSNAYVDQHRFPLAFQERIASAVEFTCRSERVSEEDTTTKDPSMKPKSEMIEGFGSATGLQALLKLITGELPVIGTVYSAFEGSINAKAAEIKEKRVRDLLSDISVRIARLDEVKINKEYLSSEEFFETFRDALDIAGKSSDSEKRTLIADYLVGRATIDTNTDFDDQVLTDLRDLKPFHLKIIRVLNDSVGSGVNMNNPPELIHDMDKMLYKKGMSDLSRFGFIEYVDEGGAIGSGGGFWITTPYLKAFKLSVSGMPGSLWNSNPQFDALFQESD